MKYFSQFLIASILLIVSVSFVESQEIPNNGFFDEVFIPNDNIIPNGEFPNLEGELAEENIELYTLPGMGEVSSETYKFFTDASFINDFSLNFGKQPFLVGHDLGMGSKVYTDRDFIYWEVPYFLNGFDYFITNNNDKFSKDDEFIKFKYATELVVYVAFDSRMQVPSWVFEKEFENTYENISIFIPDNNSFLVFDIYKKKFEAGDIVLGGNLNKEDNTNGAMYLVITNANRIPISSDGINGTVKLKVSKQGNQKIELKTTTIKEVKGAPDTINNRVCVIKKQTLSAGSSSLFFLGDSRESVLFPGNMLNISKIEKGEFISALTSMRKPYEISTDILGNNEASKIVSTPTLAAYRDAKAKLLHPTNIGSMPGAKVTFGKMESTESEVDFYIKVTGSVSSLVHSGKASFSYNKTDKKNRFFVEIEKVYYDIDYVPDNEFFVNSNIPLSPDLVYVSKVRYGSKVILLFESNYSKKEVEAALNYKYTGIGTSGSGSVEAKYKKIVKNANIQAVSLGGEKSSEDVKNMIKGLDYKSFAEAFSNSKITAKTPLYPLAYTLRYVEDRAIAVLETYAKYDQKICGKLNEIIRINFKDIKVVRSDDSSGGEELFGSLDLIASGYGKTSIFDRSENNHFPSTEGSDAPILINGTYYLKYSESEISHLDNFIQINAHLKEDDNGLFNPNDDFGRVSHKFSLAEIVAGAIDDKYQEENIDTYPCTECKVMTFTHDKSKVLIRYTIETLDKLPPNVAVGFGSFINPKIDGIALDWCKTWATGCGKPAADYFCQINGYQEAIKFEQNTDIGYTMNPTTGKICDDIFCDSFKFIDCRK